MKSGLLAEVLCGKYRHICCLSRDQLEGLIALIDNNTVEDVLAIYDLTCMACANPNPPGPVPPPPNPGPIDVIPVKPPNPAACTRIIQIVCADESLAKYSAAAAALAALATQVGIPQLATVLGSASAALVALVAACAAKDSAAAFSATYAQACSSLVALANWMRAKGWSGANLEAVKAIKAGIRFAVSAIWSPEMIQAWYDCCGIDLMIPAND